MPDAREAALATRRFRPAFNVLEGILTDVNSLSTLVPPPVDILVGFDAVVQFSARLLQAQVTQSLSRKGLLTLSALAPWQPSTVPPGLRATVAARFGLSLEAREACLEVRFTNPRIASLRWPVLPSDVFPGPIGPTARLDRPEPLLERHPRSAEIAWQLEVNILTPQYVIAVDPQVAGGPGQSWNRTLIGRGTARTPARPELEVSPRWRFGLALDFSENPPTTAADEAAIVEFLSSEIGQGLVAPAVAPLASAAGIKLTPTIGPAGSLTARQFSRLNLPPLLVRDILLTDADGGLVLAFCVDLGTPAGVPRLVQAFLARHDFAYGATVNLLGPALKARWALDGTALSFTGDAPVELPVSEDSEETATGRARLHVSISKTLDDVAIKPSTDHLGDPLRLLSQQTIKLLDLWNHEGQRFTDLGPLAEPQTEPVILPLRFDAPPGGESGQLHPTMKELLLDLLMILVYPLLDPFRITSLSGTTSSATQTLLTRWALRTPRDDARAPVTAVEAQV